MNTRISNLRNLVGMGLLSTTIMGGSIAQSSETIPKAMLVDMARSQYTVLCESEVFASCMGFTTQSCMELSDSAIKQCLLPLPEEIPLEELENSALESCPKTVYADAGFTEKKAGICFDKAMESVPGG
ncbi:MAG: hypothetical protein AB8B84_11710 [Granulosicoccus sp.]